MAKIKDYIREAAEYDFGHNSRKSAVYPTGEFTSRGKADVRASPSGKRPRYITTTDIKAVHEGDVSGIDHLQDMLNRAGVSDDEIKAGINLTPMGLQKVAARLGISADDVPALVNSLASRLDDQIDESADRYSYESDYADNVTVRDSQTGKETYLQGTKGANLLLRLKDKRNEQDILASVDLNESDDGGVEESYDSEINTDSGTYNLPWRLAGQRGTMTVFFTENKDGKPSLQIVSVRDEDGEEIDAEKLDEVSLLRQAQDFIGKE